MNPWFVADCGDPTLAGPALDRITALFAAAARKSGASPAMAVFFRHESEGRLQCALKVYFAPESAQVAKAVGAVACPRPDPRGLGLLAGPGTAWPILFPGIARQ